MSFCTDIKSELISVENSTQCCYHAQVYGLVLFAHFSEYNFSITTENKELFDFYLENVSSYLNCDVKVNRKVSKKHIAYVEDEKSMKNAFEKFGHSFGESSTRINHANIQNECCINAFLRGAFLSCGFVADPEKNYHLEFVVPFKKLSQDLMRVINELNLEPKYVMRKGNHIVYFKDSEDIEDFLAYIGAQNASLSLMSIKIEKDIKNKVNRKLNFEMHNLEKTIQASNAQVDAIKLIKRTSGFGVLPKNLRDIAELRLEYPEASLSELEKLSENSISKSGIKHRLDRLMEISETIEEKK